MNAVPRALETTVGRARPPPRSTRVRFSAGLSFVVVARVRPGELGDPAAFDGDVERGKGSERQQRVLPRRHRVEHAREDRALGEIALAYLGVHELPHLTPNRELDLEPGKRVRRVHDQRTDVVAHLDHHAALGARRQRVMMVVMVLVIVGVAHLLESCSAGMS